MTHLRQVCPHGNDCTDLLLNESSGVAVPPQVAPSPPAGVAVCICVEQAIHGLVPPLATLYGQDGNPAVQRIRGRNPETLHAQSALVDPGGRDPADGSFDHLCPTIRTSEAAGRRVAKNKAPSAASGSPRPVTQARINCSAGNTMLGATHPGGVSAPPPVATAGVPISDAAIPAAVASL